ncbi:MAG: ATP-binding cassette domain-containing protein [Bacteroidales bacterium]
MIRFQKVSFSFDGKKIIEDFTETISSGEHVCLMGESGAGKSTLLNSLMGLTTPCEGEILIDDIPVDSHHIQQVRSKIAWVPQEIHLPYEFVMETVMAPFELKVNQGIRLNEVKMYSLFEELGLEKSLYKRRMQDISGGERQRLMIAIALLLNKKILLLDEPTSAIDPQTREKMTEFLQSLDVTMLSVTHDLQFASSCHRIINISKLRTII